MLTGRAHRGITDRLAIVALLAGRTLNGYAPLARITCLASRALPGIAGRLARIAGLAGRTLAGIAGRLASNATLTECTIQRVAELARVARLTGWAGHGLSLWLPGLLGIALLATITALTARMIKEPLRRDGFASLGGFLELLRGHGLNYCRLAGETGFAVSHD